MEMEPLIKVRAQTKNLGAYKRLMGEEGSSEGDQGFRELVCKVTEQL